MPPCASNNAWNSSTTEPITLMGSGPSMIAPSPVPVGWELLPVTEGILSADSTKVNAPDKPNSSFSSGLFLVIWFSLTMPSTKNGINTAHQKTAQPTGKNPSMMCIAAAVPGSFNKK